MAAKKPYAKGRKLLRLRKVLVQPVHQVMPVEALEWPGNSALPTPDPTAYRVQVHASLDDGTALKDLPPQESEIPAAEWPTYSAVRFANEFRDWEERLNNEQAPE